MSEDAERLAGPLHVVLAAGVVSDVDLLRGAGAVAKGGEDLCDVHGFGWLWGWCPGRALMAEATLRKKGPFYIP